MHYIGLFLDNKRVIHGIKMIERNYKYPEGKCFDIKIDIDPELIEDKCVDLLIGFKQERGVD